MALTMRQVDDPIDPTSWRSFEVVDLLSTAAFLAAHLDGTDVDRHRGTSELIEWADHDRHALETAARILESEPENRAAYELICDAVTALR